MTDKSKSTADELDAVERAIKVATAGLRRLEKKAKALRSKLEAEGR